MIKPFQQHEANVENCRRYGQTEKMPFSFDLKALPLEAFRNMDFSRGAWRFESWLNFPYSSPSSFTSSPTQGTPGIAKIADDFSELASGRRRHGERGQCYNFVVFGTVRFLDQVDDFDLDTIAQEMSIANLLEIGARLRADLGVRTGDIKPSDQRIIVGINCIRQSRDLG